MSRILRIAYGGTGSPLVQKVIDFPRFAFRVTPPDYIRQMLNGKSASGKVENLTVRTDVLVDIGVRHGLNRSEPYITLKRNLKQFAQCAQRGDTFTVALDSTDSVLTTITSDPEVGDTTISLASVTGVVIGRSYVVRNEVDLEVVKVTNIAGSDITLAEPLDTAFFNGDRFRTEMYWPAKLVDSRPIIIENGPLWFDVDLRIAEDVNDL